MMLDEHLGYVSDAVRLDRYRAAIAKVIAKDSSVADLGSGSGVLGLLCLQAGAGRLFAVDDSDMLEVARESLTRSGYGDRSSFVRGKSSQIELPERVDVVICDHVGYFGFDYGSSNSFTDARKRFLKPGGTLIPSSIRLNVAAVGAQRCDELVNGWMPKAFPMNSIGCASMRSTPSMRSIWSAATCFRRHRCWATSISLRTTRSSFPGMPNSASSGMG